MAFKNEYIPPLERETSEFFRKARETLRTGHSKHDRWTADRDRNMVLFRRGGGHSEEAANEDYWSFISADGTEYSVDTNIGPVRVISAEEIAVTRSMGFRGDPSKYPSAEVIGWIKEALREYKDWGIRSDYKYCQLTLIDASTGREV